MKTFNCGHCGGRHNSLEQVKACSQVVNNPVADTTVRDRIVTTTCVTWHKDEDGFKYPEKHRWTGLLSEVVANKNVCPEHRS